MILSVGSTALYFGIVRPEVSTTPRKIQEFIDQDPATRPAITLPPMVVSEPRLPGAAADSGETSPRTSDSPARERPVTEAAPKE